MIMYGAIAVYFVMTICFFKEWLFFLNEDEESKSDKTILQVILLIMASVLWPLVVPFAYLELLGFHKKHREVFDMLLDMSNSQIMDD